MVCSRRDDESVRIADRPIGICVPPVVGHGKIRRNMVHDGTLKLFETIEPLEPQVLILRSSRNVPNKFDSCDLRNDQSVVPRSELIESSPSAIVILIATA